MMLGKLMKYDFRYMLRKFGPLWLGLLALAAVNGFTVGHVLEKGSVNGFLSFLFGVVPIILLFSLWVATCVMMIVFVCQRFYKGLLGDEGYLMFTLPATPAEHIASKLVVALVMEFITGLAALAAMLIFVMVYDGAGFLEGLRELSDVFPRLPQGSVGLLILFFLLMVASTLAQDLQIYLAISLGHMAPKNRVVISVLAYVGISVGVSILLSALPGVIRIGSLDLTIDSFSEAMETAVRYGSGALGIMIGWQLIKAAGFFFGSNAILTHKLNLE